MGQAKQLSLVHASYLTKGAFNIRELVISYRIWSNQQLGVYDKEEANCIVLKDDSSINELGYKKNRKPVFQGHSSHAEGAHGDYV
jgi:hypothetical protein